VLAEQGCEINSSIICCFSLSSSGLELVNAAVRHQRQKEIAILYYGRPHVSPILCDAIVEGRRSAHGAGERERAELELIQPLGFPSTRTTVAINSGRNASVGDKGDGVLALIVGDEFSSESAPFLQ
jgi:hypothetical protein